MATYVSAEQRAKILSAVKDEGMSIVDAAKTFLVTEDTIKKWMRKQSKNGHTSSTEMQKLRQERKSRTQNNYRRNGFASEEKERFISRLTI